MSERKQRGGDGETTLLVELSGSVGSRVVRRQESGTEAQLCSGFDGPRGSVSLHFIVREKKGRETPET